MKTDIEIAQEAGEPSRIKEVAVCYRIGQG